MLERVWRKGNLLALLVGMQTNTATMENSVEIPLKKLETELPYNPAIPLLGIHTEETRACALDLRRGPQGPALVTSGKASPHASCLGK